ncbi:glycerol-3-phosphate dehydrogenase [Kaustia mangrovi]|uniref:Glycerol-3-phosphate dehydrogenase n=1 Tax=Kaustia mangrovi TaxID=2593653 RepID=A0A7S8C3Y4_9HYPH|nr:glycerol-3-phosphate dehydrogenase [Kaustia mangrovi]QPC42877.1 glycerol-3-phosphate dehydrogenase [Kaustia mangrovi]
MGDVPYDIAIVGGGVNGCSIARDAAGRGLKVFLCEMGDLAGGTSSASTKLIHGGLRYLEQFEFRLVREALAEREILLRSAPHIVWPLRFVLPYSEGLRPEWMIRLGLFLYDRLGGRRLLPPSRRVDLRRDPAGAPLRPAFATGFEYSDCWVEDSRLVVLNAVDAAERGADIRTRTECLSAERGAEGWTLTCRAQGERQAFAVHATTLVNATGPWIGGVLADRLHATAAAPVRLVKGSHIVVRRLFDGPQAYIVQNDDGRIVFAIPYERDFTLIGTTDVDYEGDPARAAISHEETDYLLAAMATYFRTPVTRDDVVHSYSGVRPLFDEGTAEARSASRDYVLDLDAPSQAPALLNVFGGKITTSRTLAEAALDRLSDHLPATAGPAWTASAPLPGGDFPVDGFGREVRSLLKACPVLAEPHARRLVRAYGTRAAAIVEGVKQTGDLGIRFGADLHEREVAYLMKAEWAVTAEDVLWRRSRLGLHVGPEDARRLEDWMRQASRARTVPAG